MHVVVTRRATELTEVIWDYFRSAERLVTLDARNGHMTSVQRETGLLVQC